MTITLPLIERDRASISCLMRRFPEADEPTVTEIYLGIKQKSRDAVAGCMFDYPMILTEKELRKSGYKPI